MIPYNWSLASAYQHLRTKKEKPFSPRLCALPAFRAGTVDTIGYRGKLRVMEDEQRENRRQHQQQAKHHNDLDLVGLPLVT